MPRIAKNQLTIVPLFEKGIDTGFFLLSGRLNGERYRFKDKDPVLLQRKKETLERPVLELARVEATGPTIQKTRLTQIQCEDAEAAFNLLKGKSHTLQECVLAAMAVLGDGAPKDAEEAKNEFLAWQERRGLAQFTLDTNRRRIAEFLKFTGIKLLGEISPEHCEDFVNDNELEAATRAGRGRPIQTWLNWCVKKLPRKPSYLKKSPFEVDMKELNEKAGAKTMDKKRMYSAAKCESLLKASIAYNGGQLVPFTILSLWCYMRAADAKRVRLRFIHLDSDSSLEGPFIEVCGRKKGSKPRAVPIPANVVPLLKECVKRGTIREGWWLESGQVQTPAEEKKTKDWGDIPFTRHGWDEVRELAGLIRFGGLTKNKYRAVLWSDWQENILRHTGESYARRAKDDAARVSKAAGHSSSTADKHYICVPAPGDTEKFYAIVLRFPTVARIPGANHREAVA